MHRLLQLPILLFLVLAVSDVPGQNGKIDDLTPEQWSQDLRHLSEKLPKQHKNAFHTVQQVDLDSAVARLRTAIPKQDAAQNYVGMRQIVAMIGDGHTNISAPDGWPMLPIRMSWFGDPLNDPAGLQLRITQVRAPYSHALGAQIISIGNSTIAEVYGAMTTIIAGGESEGSRRSASTYWMRYPHILYGLGIITSSDTVPMKLIDDDGTERLIQITATAEGKWERATAREPLYRSKPDDDFWFTTLPDAPGTIYFAFNEYPPYMPFCREVRKLFRMIDEEPVNKLVIDLRYNSGGDYNKVRRLLIPGLRKRKQVSDPGQLYVLTGPITFSAAMTNAVDFRRELKAILVGEPTGARPNQYQEKGSFKLPNSGLVVSVAKRYYKFQEEDTPGVQPDQLIRQNWEDHLAGRDPVLEWVLAQPVP